MTNFFNNCIERIGTIVEANKKVVENQIKLKEKLLKHNGAQEQMFHILKTQIGLNNGKSNY